MKSNFRLLSSIFLTLLFFRVQAQDSLRIESFSALDEANEIDDSYNPIIFKLNDSGSRYIRFMIWNQLWIRQTENNPGTLGVDGLPRKNTTDIGLRRARFLTYAQVSPRVLFLAHLGINNQTFVNGGVPAGGNSGNAGNLPVTTNPSTGSNTLDANSSKKPQLFFHDIWTEFEISNSLFIGAGLHYWNGISRLSSQGTLNLLALDAPIFNWPLIELTDQFARQYGIYAKGQVGKWDYRVALNKPFSVGEGGTFDESTNRPMAANVANDNWATQGYIAYQFFEKENNKLPFFVGTYLGTKKVFNLGGGWHHHPGATTSVDSNGSVNTHNISLWSIDGFLELPLSVEKETALTAYAVYYTYDFGPNYLRNIGIMNVGLGPGTSQNGPGNAQPTIGTGNIFYFQTGYLLPKDILGNKGKLQPYGTLSHKRFEFFEEGSWQYDLGMNYYIDGQLAKLTFQYSNRPIFENYLNIGSAGEFILQTHIFL